MSINKTSINQSISFFIDDTDKRSDSTLSKDDLQCLYHAVHIVHRMLKMFTREINDLLLVN